MKINCIYAKEITTEETECKNSAKSHLHRAAQAYCYRCKHRVPVDNDLPPLVESMPQARQMRIEEWLKED